MLGGLGGKVEQGPLRDNWWGLTEYGIGGRPPQAIPFGQIQKGIVVHLDHTHNVGIILIHAQGMPHISHWRNIACIILTPVDRHSGPSQLGDVGRVEGTPDLDMLKHLLPFLDPNLYRMCIKGVIELSQQNHVIIIQFISDIPCWDNACIRVGMTTGMVAGEWFARHKHWNETPSNELVVAQAHKDQKAEYK